MNNTLAPSLLGKKFSHHSDAENFFTSRSLLDLMYEGFYALLMLKNRCNPIDEITFSNNIILFLEDFERHAKKMNASAEDIYAAKYAYCAAVDEIILRSQFNIRMAWERQPLQLLIFGDQLAGEVFFDKIEELRTKGSAHVQALEVFQMCLLLGFEGKYMIEGPEKLNYLIARLGDEIAHMKGKAPGFAPHWARPDQIINKLRNDVPIWVICSVFAFIAMSGYSGLNWMLTRSTSNSINAYNDIVKLAPRAANITITLP